LTLFGARENLHGQREKTDLPYEFDGEKIIVVKNVHALVYDQCGEAFVNQLR
jgi:YgiT-type zinc finger domain-containing protein